MRTIPSRRLEIGLAAIAALDLSNVKRKLQEPEPEGKNWSELQTAEAELWYRRYLELYLRHPDFPVVPNYPIDTMWHQHILDTRAYAQDCNAIFGEMLHHYPYFGLNGDAEVRDDSFSKTNELYRRYFGENCLRMKLFCRSAEAVNCGDSTGCRSGDEPRMATCMKGEGENTSVGNRVYDELVEVGSGASMGMGCGQGCSRGPERHALVEVGASCNSGGSGTGCGQGCSRGGSPFFSLLG